MQLEVGKTYITRDKNTVVFIEKMVQIFQPEFLGKAANVNPKAPICSWRSDGFYVGPGFPGPNDLVEEVEHVVG